MTIKEYLSQAFHVDQRINSKLDQVASLNELAKKATTTISDMPGKATKNITKMEDVIIKIVAMEAEINEDIEKLVSLKAEITNLIKRIERLEYQTLLEKRYLCFQTWEQIAVDMGYNIRWIHRLHSKALDEARLQFTEHVDYKTPIV